MAKYPTKPKAPKRSAGLKTWENYKKRVDEWKRKCKNIDASIKRKEALIKSVGK